jgi:anaerobic magnesium-protoporphyrin IX monomethyl ester cyclase
MAPPLLFLWEGLKKLKNANLFKILNYNFRYRFIIERPYMRIKLINPPVIDFTSEFTGIDIPYGIGVLAMFLRQNNFSVTLNDLNALLRSPYSHLRSRKILREDFKFCKYQENIGHYTGILDKRNVLLADSLFDLVDLSGCDVVGIGITSRAQILNALLLTEKIKKEYKIPVIFGGPYVTLFAELFFKKYTFIDYAIVGEGEVPLLKFLNYMQGKCAVQNVPSLWHRDKTKDIFNGRTFYDIEDQSCPDFEGFSLRLYNCFIFGKSFFGIPYLTSRGCPNQCTYCTYSSLEGPWQCKSIRKVIEDITFLKEKCQSRFFNFEDANFNVSYEYVDKLCDAFINMKVDIQWIARAYPHNLDISLLTKMKKAGCQQLRFGIESGSDRVLRMMKRNVDVKSQVKILKMAKAAGIENVINLIIGYPYETALDLKKTAIFLKKNADVIDRVHIYTLVIYYGSYLFNNAADIQIKIKEYRITFFTYFYDYETMEGNISRQQRKTFKRLMQKIVWYNYRYVYCKQFRFPLNIVAKYFGKILKKTSILIKNRVLLDGVALERLCKFFYKK